jgi:hypothetical protein
MARDKDTLKCVIPSIAALATAAVLAITAPSIPHRAFIAAVRSLRRPPAHRQRCSETKNYKFSICHIDNLD